MTTFHLRKVEEYRRHTYGLLMESVEIVNVTGRAAHSAHHPHRVQVWDSEWCTGGHGTHVLNAEAIVIANPPAKQSPRLDTVREGDTVRLVYPDGTEADYTVTAQWLRDPKLTPVAPKRRGLTWIAMLSAV